MKELKSLEKILTHDIADYVEPPNALDDFDNIGKSIGNIVWYHESPYTGGGVEEV
jgi:hypothetical protein